MNFVIKEAYLKKTNQFAHDYEQGLSKAQEFFHYAPFEQASYHKRAMDLAERTFLRQELAEVIRNHLERWGNLSPKQEEALERLASEDSLVVIGGQQAGLLLGPLYTIYKALTIIQTAREQEKLLGKPVIPVFWIAGEDHDYQEINHVYIPRTDGSRMDKFILEDREETKLAISCRKLDKEAIKNWLESLRKSFPETEFTATLFEQVEVELAQSVTFVDFFARLMNRSFAQHGLLMIDSANQSLRKLESEVFVQIIRHYDRIFALVRQAVDRMTKEGYTPQITIGEHPALLFIFEQGARLLLEKRGSHFQTKDGMYTYTEEELIQIAEETPWKLSNNVITRPFMQESLFPTLAFVAGPGEIAYWALYKDYFTELGLNLPIVVPRISITLVERPIASILERRGITFQDVFDDFKQYRENWLAEQDKLDLAAEFKEVREEISHLYAPLIEKIGLIELGLKELGEKNLAKIMEQVNYLEKRTMAANKRQHEAALRQFDKVEQALYPHGSLQERVYSPYYFFNKHGFGLVDRLLEQTLEINGKHKFIYL